jgi:hypothetical protein
MVEGPLLVRGNQQHRAEAHLRHRLERHHGGKEIGVLEPDPVETLTCDFEGLLDLAGVERFDLAGGAPDRSPQLEATGELGRGAGSETGSEKQAEVVLTGAAETAISIRPSAPRTKLFSTSPPLPR